MPAQVKQCTGTGQSSFSAWMVNWWRNWLSKACPQLCLSIYLFIDQWWLNFRGDPSLVFDPSELWNQVTCSFSNTVESTHLAIGFLVSFWAHSTEGRSFACCSCNKLVNTQAFLMPHCRYWHSSDVKPEGHSLPCGTRAHVITSTYG